MHMQAYTKAGDLEESRADAAIELQKTLQQTDGDLEKPEELSGCIVETWTKQYIYICIYCMYMYMYTCVCVCIFIII
jgi:hypothetical protein